MSNRKRAAARDLITDGMSNTQIGRQLHMDRHDVADIRRELGLPNVPRQPLTLEEKWKSFTQPVDGGHLQWSGEHQSTSGTPVMRYRGETHSPTAIAFRIRHGREPHGYAYAECGHEHCVAPDHVDDATTRLRDREQLRHLMGGRARPQACVHGHDQAQWGRYEPDGRAYCHACKRIAKGRAIA